MPRGKYISEEIKKKIIKVYLENAPIYDKEVAERFGLSTTICSVIRREVLGPRRPSYNKGKTKVN